MRRGVVIFIVEYEGLLKVTAREWKAEVEYVRTWACACSLKAKAVATVGARTQMYKSVNAANVQACFCNDLSDATCLNPSTAE